MECNSPELLYNEQDNLHQLFAIDVIASYSNLSSKTKLSTKRHLREDSLSTKFLTD